MGNKNEFLRGKPADASGEQLLSFAFKATAFFIILAGLQAAAQKFASLVAYDPGWVGQAAHTVTLFNRDIALYPFWRLFSWTLMSYRRTDVHPLLYAA
jgi:hypothetical protein